MTKRRKSFRRGKTRHNIASKQIFCKKCFVRFRSIFMRWGLLVKLGAGSGGSAITQGKHNGLQTLMLVHWQFLSLNTLSKYHQINNHIILYWTKCIRIFDKISKQNLWRSLQLSSDSSFFNSFSHSRSTRHFHLNRHFRCLYAD